MAHSLPTLVEGTNSYPSKDNADSYFANRLNHAAWDSLTPENQFRALITASQQISRFVIDSAKLPVTVPAASALQDATFELALAMASDAAVVTQASTSKNIKRVKAGSAEVEFFKSGSGSNTGSRFPSIVMDILREGGFIAGSAASAPFVSGTDAQSKFTDCDVFSRNTGFSQ